jgi:hypothetical protein
MVRQKSGEKAEEEGKGRSKREWQKKGKSDRKDYGRCGDNAVGKGKRKVEVKGRRGREGQKRKG